MVLEDLEYIFKDQIDLGATKVFYMLESPERCVVERCDVDKLETLLPMLATFHFSRIENNMPRFSQSLPWYGKLGSYKE